MSDEDIKVSKKQVAKKVRKTKESTKKGFDPTEYQRGYYAEKAAARRDVKIRECADMARRLELLDNPLKFLKYYLEDRFWRPFSADQEETIHEIIHAAEVGADEIFCAPRGDWKTETIKGMTLYLIAKVVVKFPVLVGATADDAMMKYKDVKKQFDSNDRFTEDFPEICDPIIALKGSPQAAARQTFQGKSTDYEWGAKYVTFPRIAEVPGTGERSPYWNSALTYRGLEGHIRGINLYSHRPDLALCDDLETEESADSDEQIKKREKLLDRAIAGLAGGGEKLPRVVVGTIQNNKCLTYRKLKEWGGRQYQAVNKWPSDRGMERAEEYVEIRKREKAKGSKTYDEARKFYRENIGIIEEGVELGNPECYSRKTYDDGSPVQISGFQRVLDAAAEYDWKYVYCELQNDPPDESKIETIGLTYTKIMKRVSGYHQQIIADEDDETVATIDLGKYACHWGVAGWRKGFVGHFANYGVQEVHGTGTGGDDAYTDMCIRSALLNWRSELMGGHLSNRPPSIVLIDSGDFTDMVYGFVKEFAGSFPCFAIKGLSPYRQQKPVKGSRIVGDYWHANAIPEKGVWLYRLDTDSLKGMAHQMWSTPTFDEAQQFNPMTLSLFSAFTQEGQADSRRHLSFAKHQTAEEYREEFVPGKGKKTGWHQINANNHWFDMVYMNLAGAIMRGITPPFDGRPIRPTQPPRAKSTKTRRQSQFSRGNHGFVATRSA